MQPDYISSRVLTDSLLRLASLERLRIEDLEREISFLEGRAS